LSKAEDETINFIEWGFGQGYGKATKIGNAPGFASAL
jgi:hypothetical protein